jgi:succinyl-CoA synthetase beta subunit
VLKIHEFQAKEILRKHEVPVPEGKVATTVEDAVAIAKEIGPPVMVKAQVYVGGRGKAGGVKFCPTVEDAEKAAKAILGMDIKGLTVEHVLVADAVDIDMEYYVGLVIDRAAQKVVLMISGEGGVEIETVAKEMPEKLFKIHIEPGQSPDAARVREVFSKLEDDPDAVGELTDCTLKLCEAFKSVDASLAEINPMVKTKDGKVWAVDAKINLDDNGLFRHEGFEEMRDPEENKGLLRKARELGLSYIKLDGDVGCVVNGAGLAMATMDLIKHYGAEPANFLDIGGSSRVEKVTTAMEIITQDPNVKVILFNIFGGITRCDDVANGIIEALKVTDLKVPIVVRLTGTNEEEARKLLESINLVATTSMDDGVKQAVGKL